MEETGSNSSPKAPAVRTVDKKEEAAIRGKLFSECLVLSDRVSMVSIYVDDTLKIDYGQEMAKETFLIAYSTMRLDVMVCSS